MDDSPVEGVVIPLRRVHVSKAARRAPVSAVAPEQHRHGDVCVGHDERVSAVRLSGDLDEAVVAVDGRNVANEEPLVGVDVHGDGRACRCSGGVDRSSAVRMDVDGDAVGCDGRGRRRGRRVLPLGVERDGFAVGGGEVAYRRAVGIGSAAAVGFSVPAGERVAVAGERVFREMLRLIVGEDLRIGIPLAAVRVEGDGVADGANVRGERRLAFDGDGLRSGAA